MGVKRMGVLRTLINFEGHPYLIPPPSKGEEVGNRRTKSKLLTQKKFQPRVNYG